MYVDLSAQGYQTRTTTIITVDSEDNVTFLEKNHTGDKTVREYVFKCDTELQQSKKSI